MPEKVKKSRKSDFVLNLVKGGVFAVIAIAVVTSSFFLENRFAARGEVVEEKTFEFDYVEQNFVPDRGVIRFAGEEEHGFVNDVEVLASSDDEYVFGLNSGKFWGNFVVSNAQVNVVVGKVVLIPDHAAFDVEFDGKRIELAVYDGDVYVGLLDDEVEISEYVDEYDDIFVNKILVPRDTQIKVSLSKLDERIEALLYSKLVKELKYSAIAETDRESDWVKDNFSKDRKFVESTKQAVISDTIFKGASISDTAMGRFIFWAKENFTFIPDKKNEMIFDHLFTYLDDSIFYANEGDEAESNSSWEEFNGYLATLPTSVSGGEEFFDRLDKYIDELSVFGPEDEQYEILQKMLDKKILARRDVYEVVNMYWLDVYDGLKAGSVAAEEALDRYYTYFDKTLGKDTDSDFYRDYITYNNQLFDNLLLRYSIFYRDGYFAIKDVLERELLGLYEEGQLKDELAQAFISNKITFLKRLMNFFFEGDVTVEEAKEILSRLIEEVDDLMPVDDSGVAVIELFESQLENIGDFYGYLNSPEYHISKTYGINHEERYRSYLDEKDKIWDFITIQEEVLGETGVEVSIADVKREIGAVFEENVDVSVFEVGEVETVDQRYVGVKGMIGGYPFDATYDRDQGSLKDVYTYGELVSDRAVKLGNLLDLMVSKFADLAEVEVEEEEFTEESLAQRRARLFITEKVAEFGFMVDMENVSILDEANAVYRVQEASLEGYEDISVMFDFMMNIEKATNIFMTVKGEPVTFDEEFTLEELATMVVAEYDFSEGISVRPDVSKISR